MSQKTAFCYKNIIRNAKLRKLTSVDFFQKKQKTRTYETSESCDRVHLGHLKKKNFEKKFFEKKLKKNSKVENQNISYGRAS